MKPKKGDVLVETRGSLRFYHILKDDPNDGGYFVTTCVALWPNGDLYSVDTGYRNLNATTGVPTVLLTGAKQEEVVTA